MMQHTKRMVSKLIKQQGIWVLNCLSTVADSFDERPAKFAGTRCNYYDGSGARQNWKKWVVVRFPMWNYSNYLFFKTQPSTRLPFWVELEPILNCVDPRSTRWSPFPSLHTRTTSEYENLDMCEFGHTCVRNWTWNRISKEARQSRTSK